jgi:hypothetical protein
MLAVGGALAAVALAVRGLLDLRNGSGWGLLIAAALMAVAILLGQRLFRDGQDDRDR